MNGGKEVCPDSKACFTPLYMTAKKIEYSRLKRKNDEKCPECGCEKDRQGYYCKKCLKKHNDYQRENRAFWRSNHICPECGKERLFGTEKTCIACRQKTYEWKQKHKKPLSDEQKADMRDYSRSVYQERSKNGICTRCGKRKAAPNRKKCKICLEKDAEKHRLPSDAVFKMEYKEKNSLCRYCGSPLESGTGKKVCAKCIQKCRDNALKLRKLHPEKFPQNKSWKEGNQLIFKN